MRTIKALWLSFFSRSFYAETFYSGKGVGILLIVLLVLIHTLVITITLHQGLNQFVTTIAPGIVQQIPAITFTGGKAFTKESRVYQIRDPKSGQLIAVVDTMAEHPPADLDGAIFFVAQKSLTIQKSKSEQRSYDYSGIKEMVIDESFIHFWLAILARWGALVAALFILPVLGIYRALQWLFFSVVTLAISAIWDVSGSYAAKLRITALALTPALLLEVLGSVFSVDFPGINILFFALVCAYISLGAQAASSFCALSPSPRPLP